jgi:citrate lyase beta subunit
MIDGKMQDDATYKQCQVVLRLARDLAVRDPTSPRRTAAVMRAPVLRSVLYLPASNARAVEKARTLPADALILDLEDAVAPGRQGGARERPAPPCAPAATATGC